MIASRWLFEMRPLVNPMMKYRIVRPGAALYSSHRRLPCQPRSHTSLGRAGAWQARVLFHLLRLGSYVSICLALVLQEGPPVMYAVLDAYCDIFITLALLVEVSWVM